MDEARYFYLNVDGEIILDLHDYCVRWVRQEVGHRAELYHNGRRVTRPWRLTASASAPADVVGGNANTE